MTTTDAPPPLPAPATAGAAGRAAVGLAGGPDGPTRSAASDAAVFTAGLYGAQLLLFVAGIIQKGLLGPVAAGYWALMVTYVTVQSAAPLGVFDGAARQVPFHRGRGDRATAAAIADTAFSFSLAASAVAGAFVVAVALGLGGGWASEVRYGLVALAAIAPLRVLADAHESLVQSTRRFGAATQVVLARAFVALSVQTLLILWVGYWGLFAGAALASLTTLVLYTRLGLTGRRRPAFHFRVERPRVRELMRYGLPILVLGQVWALFLAVDNLVVARYLGVRDLGFYALAVSVTTYITLLPKAVGAALSPRMSAQFAKTEEVGSLRHYVIDVQRLLASLLIPCFVAAAYFGLPVLIRHALPAFTPAIPVVHVMVVASFFVSLATMPTKLLMSAGYRWVLTAVTLACLVLNAAANLFAVVVLEAGLVGAAIATAASYGVFFTIMTAFALSRSMAGARVVAHLAELLGIIAYVTVALGVIEATVGSGAGGLMADVAIAGGKLLLFGVTLVPWVVVVQRRYGAVDALIGLVRDGWLRGRSYRRSA